VPVELWPGASERRLCQPIPYQWAMAGGKVN